MPRQKLADRGHRPVELTDLRVDLDSVAGAEDQRACDVVGLGDVVQELLQRVAGQRDTLERRQWRAPVAESHHQNAHVPTACTPVV